MSSSNEQTSDTVTSTSNNTSSVHFNSVPKNLPYKPAQKFVIPDKHFTVVEFPGVVKNEEKALEMLGGIQNITKAVNQEKKFVELRFRPNDPLSHPAYGDVLKTNRLLMKITRRRPKNRRDDKSTHHLSFEMIGNIQSLVKFEGMVDFQYLAPKKESKLPKKKFSWDMRRTTFTTIGDVHRQQSHSESNRHDIDTASSIPTGIDEKLHLPPPTFSKHDHPLDYGFRSNPNATTVLVTDKYGGITYKRKIKPKKNQISSPVAITFSEKDVPTHPPTMAMTDEHELLQFLREKFKERPIWSRMALGSLCGSKRDYDRLKLLLPHVAYCFLSGPWRSLWVRYGYDPRKKRSASYFQLLDFRVPPEVRETLKRQNNDAKKSVPIRKSSNLDLLKTHIQNKTQDDEILFNYKFDTIPPQAQTNYQLCDIRIKQVQEIVKGQNTREKCDERTGWYSQKALQKIRNIMKEKVIKWMKEGNENDNDILQEPEDYDLSDDEINEEEEEEKKEEEDDDDEIPMIDTQFLEGTLEKTYLDFRQYKKLKETKIPQEISSLIKFEKFIETQNYGLDKMKLHLIRDFYSLVESLLMLWFYVYPWLWNQCLSISIGIGFSPKNEIIPSAILYLFSSWFSTFTNLPFRLYDNFVIEKKYGFNNMTLDLFIVDLLKSEFLNIIIGVPILCLFVYILQWGGKNFYIYLYFFVLIITIIGMWVYPNLIQPWFNKVEPLPPSELKDKIEELAKSVNFPLSDLYQIDGSKRSEHSNAYFYGLWWKRIVLFDTLIKQLNVREVLAVLAHELGHWKKWHTLQMMIIVQIQIFVLFFTFGQFMGNDMLYESFGFIDQKPVFIGFTLFMMIYSPITHVLNFLMNMLSRKNEFEADAFAASLGFAEDLKASLTKLHIKNLGNLNPDPLYSAYHFSHPPLVERLKALNKTE